MGAIKNLTVAFGPLTFGVGMHKATEPRDAISCNRLHKKVETVKNEAGEEQEVVTLHKTGQKVVCTVCKDGDEPLGLSGADITSGFEYQKGKFVEITKEEKDALKVDGTDTILIDAIIKRNLLFDKPYLLSSFYYLTPPHTDRKPSDAYALIMKELKNDVAIGHTVLSGRTVPVAIMAGEKCLHMYTLLFEQDEVRGEPSVDLPMVNPAHAKITKSILDTFRVDDLDLNYTDEYRAGFNAMVDNKVKGVAPEVLPPAPPTIKVSSIEEMLKEALVVLEASKGQKARRGKKKEKVSA